MSLNQFMQMLVQLEMMSHGTNPEQGKITKTEAVQWLALPLSLCPLLASSPILLHAQARTIVFALSLCT